MLSIITAVHNQLAMNKIFIRTLKEYTNNSYELIIIDNNSTDGSRELFVEAGAIVIANDSNYSYPYCQNQGIRKATGKVLAFFNNDIIVSPDWDRHLLTILGKNNYHVVSFASPDRGINTKETLRQGRRWKWVKYPVLKLMGETVSSLLLMFRLSYGNWQKFCLKQLNRYGYKMSEGFSGSVIAMDRTGLERVGFWDERMQDADFDLYMRTKKRSDEHNDLQPLSIISGVFMHHYGKLTLKSKKKPVVFTDKANLISFDTKWHITMKEVALRYLRQD